MQLSTHGFSFLSTQGLLFLKCNYHDQRIFVTLPTRSSVTSPSLLYRTGGIHRTIMSASCCEHDHGQAPDPQRGNKAYRRVLWAALAINAGMFGVEVIAGVAASSASLQADALDFLGDTGNYAISLFVVGMALRYRAIAALFKGATMGGFGLWGSASRLGMDGMGRCRKRSRWAVSALPP